MNQITCQRCKRVWDYYSEQAAAIRLYGQCIVCCVEDERTDNYSWSIAKVQEERKRAMEEMDKEVSKNRHVA